QRHEESDGGRGINEARVVASLSLWRMLGHINRCAAVFAAKRQSLDEAEGDECDWSEEPDRREAGQEADRRRGCAHDDECCKKRLLSAKPVTDASKEERADRSHRETNGKGRERFEEGGGRVVGRIELVRQDSRKRAENEEVVPLDHRARTGRDEDGSHRARGDGGRSHARSCGASDSPATLVS